MIPISGNPQPKIIIGSSIMLTIQPHSRLTIEVFMLPTAWNIFSNAMPRFITTENRNAILEY